MRVYLLITQNLDAYKLQRKAPSHEIKRVSCVISKPLNDCLNRGLKNVASQFILRHSY